LHAILAQGEALSKSVFSFQYSVLTFMMANLVEWNALHSGLIKTNDQPSYVACSRWSCNFKSPTLHQKTLNCL